MVNDIINFNLWYIKILLLKDSQFQDAIVANCFLAHILIGTLKHAIVILDIPRFLVLV